MKESELVSVSRIRQIISLIDLTNLNDNCDYAAIEMLCSAAKTPTGYVAALCVWPALYSTRNNFSANIHQYILSPSSISPPVSIMLDAIALSPRDVGFKAAGGIKTIDDANLYLNLSEQRLGQEWAGPANFRFGASGLLQDALSKLDFASSADNNGDY